MEKILMCRGSKGQIFLAAAIVMIVGLVLMKSMLSLYGTIEEKRHNDIMLDDKRIENIKNEYEYIVGIASMQGDANVSGISYLANFSGYIRYETTDVKVFYVFVYSNSTSQKFSITAGNFLKDKINLTMNATGSTPVGVNQEMNDKTNKTWEFQGTADDVNITITYDYQSSVVKDKFAISTNKNSSSGFFDIIIENDVFMEKKVFYRVFR